METCGTCEWWAGKQIVFYDATDDSKTEKEKRVIEPSKIGEEWRLCETKNNVLVGKFH
jgi:hypothetical protein